MILDLICDLLAVVAVLLAVGLAGWALDVLDWLRGR